jgi:hypothetical protein
MKNIYLAIRTVFGERKYFLVFILLSVIFFSLFIVIPLITIPGNDLMFQLHIFRTRDYSLMAFLAILVGTNLALQVYNWQKQRVKQKLSRAVTKGVSSGVFGIFGAVVGTAACASCLASLFSFIGLGTGSVFFVLKNQTLFLLGAIVAMLVSLYFVSRKINKMCHSC